MTLEAVYAVIGGDYNDMMDRIGSESLIERYLLKFPADEAMPRLIAAVEAGDIEESFQAAHMLKGVVENLGITKLAKMTSNLVEQLRSRENVADVTLYETVRKEYETVVSAIKA